MDEGVAALRGDSREVSSLQQGAHPRLLDALRRHFAHPDRAPIADHAQRAADRIQRFARGRPLWLDSGCGDGLATRTLARAHPDFALVGVDRSRARLRHAVGEGEAAIVDGALLVRTELAALWHALVARELRLGRHALFYPNPWPKPAHYLRRWPAHPAFRALVELGGQLELRCNWRPYAEEMQAALRFAGATSRLEPYEPDVPLTRFERKYAASGHALWRLCASLDACSARPRDD